MAEWIDPSKPVPWDQGSNAGGPRTGPAANSDHAEVLDDFWGLNSRGSCGGLNEAVGAEEHKPSLEDLGIEKQTPEQVRNSFL